MAPTPERVEQLRKRLGGEPEFADIINVLWWEEVGARVSELPPDQRTQAEDHLQQLLLLLSDDDNTDNEDPGDPQ